MRQNVILAMLLTIFVMLGMVGWIVNAIYQQQLTDNQTMAALRDQNATLRRQKLAIQQQFDSTAISLDQQALATVHLQDEVHDLESELEAYRFMKQSLNHL